MSKLPPRLHESAAVEPSDTLSDRIVERVLNARMRLEKKTGAKPHVSSRTREMPVDAETDGDVRQLQSLKRVFRDFGVSYRSYRRQTGRPVDAGLREAAYQFRANPSLPALITVAAHLDGMGLLS